MADRTVNVRLRLDTTAWQRGARQAEQDSRRIAQTTQRAAQQAQQSTNRSAAAATQAQTRAQERIAAAAERSAVRQTAAQRRAALQAQVSAAAQARATAAQERVVERSAARQAAAQQGAYARMRTEASLWAREARARANEVGRSMALSAAHSERVWRGVRTASLGLAAAFGLAVVAAARFDKAMSGVRAVSGASVSEMSRLRIAALDAGKNTAYSATQAADAEAELSRAGVSVADITGGALKGSLSLAAAGQLDLANAATLSAQAMNTFGLHGRDVSHIADVLAAGANKSAADVNGLGEALRQGGLLAHQTGLSLDDTVAVLSAFADHALVGSDAGTSLKTMLQALNPQSKQAAEMMAKLGFSAYDSQGRFVGLVTMAGRMQKAFGNLSPAARNAAMATIFGSDATRAAAIITDQGAAGIRRYAREVNDQGAASRMAAVQMDNLAGDLEQLKGALETALIESGSGANSVLRDMVQAVTAAVNAYNNLPGPLKTTVTALSGVTGAIGLAAATAFLAVPRVVAFRSSLSTLALTMPRLAAAARATTGFIAGPWGLILAGGITALTLFGSAHEKAKPDVEGLTEAVQQDSGAIGANTRAYVANELEKAGALRAAERLGLSTRTLTDAVLGNGRAIGIVNKQMSPFNDLLAGSGGTTDTLARVNKSFGTSKGSFDQFKDAVGAVNGAVTGTGKALKDAVSAAKRQAAATGKATGSTKDLGSAAETTASDLQDQRTEAEKLRDALDALDGKNISAAEGEIRFQQSVADLTKTVKENGHSLDTHTEKGRKVKQSFLDAARAIEDHAQAVADQKNSVAAGDRVLAQDVAQLRKNMRQAHFTKAQIDSLTGAYLQLPGSVSTTLHVNTAGAYSAIAAIRAYLKAIPDEYVRVHVDQVGHAVTSGGMGHTMLRSYGGMISRYAGGGTVPGYAPRQDIVPALLSPGEAVLVPEAVRALGGPAAIAAINLFGRKGVAHFAGGGTVGTFQPTSFSYTPAGPPVLGGTGDAMDRYNTDLQRLTDAWKKLNSALAEQTKRADALRDAEKNLARVRKHHHTAAQLRAAETRVDKAEDAKAQADKTVKSAKAAVDAADVALGVKKGSKAPKHFDLKAYEKQLAASTKATEVWRRNLDKVGARGGQQVRDILEGMGKDGEKLTAALAKASKKDFDSIVKNLEKVQGAAKATLADFDKQVAASNKQNASFASDLQKLASRGYGALAQQLAAQGDQAAMDLAHQAAGASDKQLSQINSDVQKQGAALTGDDLANSLVVLTTLRSKPGAGFTQLLQAGLDMGTLRALIPRMIDQINKLPAQYRTEFLKEWASQGGGATAMARGAIFSGRTPVLAAEVGRPEAWIPLDGSARSRALLGQTAALAGYGLVPAGRWAAPSAGPGGGPVHVDRSQTVHLHGAHQTLAEQRADLLRHMAVLA